MLIFKLTSLSYHSNVSNVMHNPSLSQNSSIIISFMTLCCIILINNHTMMCLSQQISRYIFHSLMSFSFIWNLVLSKEKKKMEINWLSSSVKLVISLKLVLQNYLSLYSCLFLFLFCLVISTQLERTFLQTRMNH